MGDIWLHLQDYMFWIIHVIGFYILWDVSNRKQYENTLINTPFGYYVIGLMVYKIAMWFDNLPRG